MSPCERDAPSTTLKAMNTSRSTSSRTDLALLFVRLAVGATFMVHGINKFQDLAGTEGFFDSLGIPAPGLMAPLIAFLETFGGLALILGLLLPLVGLSLALNMLVAGLTNHTGQGFLAVDGGYELVLVLGVASLALAVAGGRLSLDAVLAARIPGYPSPAPSPSRVTA